MAVNAVWRGQLLAAPGREGWVVPAKAHGSHVILLLRSRRYAICCNVGCPPGVSKQNYCSCGEIMLKIWHFSCCRAASLLCVALATCQGMSFSTTRKWMASARSWAAQGEALPASEQQEKQSGLLQRCCTLCAGATAVCRALGL